MKLLIYSHFFAPSVGGVEAFSMSLARGLAREDAASGTHKCHVTLVTQTPAGNFSDEELAFRVVRGPSLLELWRLIGEAETVLAVGPAMLPMAFTLLRRKRLLAGHHGYQAVCPNGLLFHHPSLRSCVGHFRAGKYWECVRCNASSEGWHRSFALLVLTFPRRALCRIATRNVPVSHHSARRVELPRAQVIANGVADFVSSTHLSESPPLRPDPPSFAYVGRLVIEKGVHVLIEAAGLLKKRGRRFHIDIIGDGPECRRLQSMSRELDLEEHVQFRGFQQGPELEQLLRSVPVMIIPSVWEDVAPFAAIEQMMQERLIIASDIGGLAEVLGETGLKFPPGDAAALADRMELVLQQPELIRTLGSLARDRALEEYTQQRMIQGYRDLLHG